MSQSATLTPFRPCIPSISHFGWILILDFNFDTFENESKIY